MKAFIAFYRSSIGKKIIMSLTGLFLCSFLLEHVVGNSFLFAGKEAFDSYSEFMVNNIIIRTIEFGLAASLLFHPFVALVLWIDNKRSRPEKYEVYRLDENTILASRITMLSGSMVLLFLVVHLNTFFVPLRFADVKPSPYDLVQQAFSSAYYGLFYIAALVLLGYHLRHGFQSAFQTLGLRTKRYIGLLDAAAFLFWCIIPAWYAAMPVYFYFVVGAVPGPMAGALP